MARENCKHLAIDIGVSLSAFSWTGNSLKFLKYSKNSETRFEFKETILTRLRWRSGLTGSTKSGQNPRSRIRHENLAPIIEGSPVTHPRDIPHSPSPALKSYNEEVANARVS